MSNSEMIRNLIFCPSYQGNDEFLVEIQGRGLILESDVLSKIYYYFFTSFRIESESNT